MGSTRTLSRAIVADRPAALRFASAARGYWLGVFPLVRRELARWRALAEQIPDPVARELALHGLSKGANIEGAAAFATFAPRAHRAAVVRATVAFQAAYNHLDVLSERSPRHGGPGRACEIRRLHEPLLDALAPHAWLGLPKGDQASETGDRYLDALVDACRRALLELPCYGVAAPYALRTAERVLGYQEFAAARSPAEQAVMERWAHERTPPGSGLRWWEALAAAGSSLGVHATITAAALPGLDVGTEAAIDEAYFPSIGGLHSLLDHLIDVEEDSLAGQPNLIARYSGAEEAAARMRMLAERALESARSLSSDRSHELIVAAMAGLYLAAPGARTAEAAPVAAAVLGALGPLAEPSLLVFQARGALARARRIGRRGSDRELRALTALTARSSAAHHA
ncbi:MAG: DUF2600 family protein [Solirubrobacteraceae bacterium]